MDALGSALKEKKHTWSKSCKESAKGETEFFKMLESSANDAKTEDNERSRLKNTLKQLRKERDEENEAVHFWKKCSKIWKRSTRGL